MPLKAGNLRESNVRAGSSTELRGGETTSGLCGTAFTQERPQLKHCPLPGWQPQPSQLPTILSRDHSHSLELPEVGAAGGWGLGSDSGLALSQRLQGLKRLKPVQNKFCLLSGTAEDCWGHATGLCRRRIQP